MTTALLHRLRLAGIATTLAGTLALVAMVLHLSPLVIVGAISITVAGGGLTIYRSRELKLRIEHASSAVGAFIRGSFDARIIHIQGLDELGKLQHRINNLLDIVDLSIRHNEAAVDTGDDAEYLSKLAGCSLFTTLRQQAEHVPVLEIPTQLDINPMLAQLKELRNAVTQMQVVCSALVARAEDIKLSAVPQTQQLSATLRKTVHHARGSSLTVKNLHTASEKISSVAGMLDRLTERSEILALNMAISAAHTDGDERINAAVGSVRLLADQTRDTQQKVAGMVDEMHGAAHAGMRMIYEIASLVHDMNEMFKDVANQNGHGAKPDAEHIAFLTEAQQSIEAAIRLGEQSSRLEKQIKQLSEAA